MESAHLLIGMKVISWVIGFIAFYLFANVAHEKKKLQFQEVTSQLVNFVLCMWFGKILLNISSFIKSPLAILAYPSNSQSFYLATFLMVIVILYKRLKKQFDVAGFMEAFMYVFLAASLTYEFIQLVWNDHAYIIGQFILLAALILIYLVSHNRIKSDYVGFVMLIVWSASALGLSMVQPLFTVFGYTIAPWFLMLILASSIIYLISIKGKKVL